MNHGEAGNRLIEPFAKFVEAIAPWLGQTVLVGGWALRLYRNDPARTIADLPDSHLRNNANPYFACEWLRITIAPMVRTSGAATCFSYHAAFMT